MILEIDGVPAEHQPTSVTWNPPELLGYNGNGAPIYSSYRTCNLGFDRLMTPDNFGWSEASDGEEHDILLPHPDSGTPTVFSCYVARVAPRMDARNECRGVNAGLDVLLNKIEVT
jgi:hypothetical protein